MYAHLHKEHAEYFVISGIPRSQDGDLFGTAVQVVNGHCTVEDSAWMLSGIILRAGYAGRKGPFALPGLHVQEECDSMGNCHYDLRTREEEDLLRDLVLDAIERGVKAWGAAEFRSRACKPELMKADAMVPVLLSTCKRTAKRMNRA